MSGGADDQTGGFPAAALPLSLLSLAGRRVRSKARGCSAMPAMASEHPRSLLLVAEDENVLRAALCSRSCLWQLTLTLAVCSSVHVLLSWGTMSDWAAHDPVDICLFAWAHPDGYGTLSLGVTLMVSMPVDAIATAFFACLGAMARMGDVQRGYIAHVPAEALQRGPLWLLFPRGVEALPRLSALLSVTVVWGALWGGLCLGLLTASWVFVGGLVTGRSLCVSGWTYAVGRACWSTSEALLVSAGSFLLWSSKGARASHTRPHDEPSAPPSLRSHTWAPPAGLDPTSRSLAERARMRREVDEDVARKAAASFGAFQWIGGLVALVVIGLGVWAWWALRTHIGLPHAHRTPAAS